jgi:hypothetical protein
VIRNEDGYDVAKPSGPRRGRGAPLALARRDRVSGERNRECTLEGCTNKRKRTELVCPDHWFKIPKNLRDEVWRTYRRFGAFSDPYNEAVSAAYAVDRLRRGRQREGGERAMNREQRRKAARAAARRRRSTG